MNEGTLYKYRGKLRIPSTEGVPNLACYACTDLKKTPYRFRSNGRYIYILLPCYHCEITKYHLERKKYPPVEPTDRWESMSIEAQTSTLPALLEESDEPRESDVVERSEEPN